MKEIRTLLWYESVYHGLRVLECPPQLHGCGLLAQYGMESAIWDTDSRT